MEKARIPLPAEHSSYQKHRRQFWIQIFIPLLVVIVVILMIATLTSIATFRDEGDVNRWAAVSTIWIIIPVMGAGLFLLLIFIGLIYALARLLQLVPPYTGHIQKVIWRIENTIKRGADSMVKPVLALESITAAIKRLTGIK